MAADPKFIREVQKRCRIVTKAWRDGCTECRKHRNYCREHRDKALLLSLNSRTWLPIYEAEVFGEKAEQ